MSAHTPLFSSLRIKVGSLDPLITITQNIVVRFIKPLMKLRS